MSGAIFRDIGNVSEPSQAFLAAADIVQFLDVWLSNDLLSGEEAQVFSIYYESYPKSFTSRIRKFYAGQIREAENVLTQQSEATILEVGCGLGTEPLWLALKGGQVSAIDVRQDRVNTARAGQSVLEREIGRSITYAFDCGSFLELDDGERFDVIWMEQAFHHLEPRRDVLRKTIDLLKPDGHLVISEPNALNPILQLELFIRQGLPRAATEEDPDRKLHPYGAQRATMAGAPAEILEGVGVQRVSVRHFRTFPSRPVFDCFSGIEARPSSNTPAPLFTNFNYVGQKSA